MFYLWKSLLQIVEMTFTRPTLVYNKTLRQNVLHYKMGHPQAFRYIEMKPLTEL